MKLYKTGAALLAAVCCISSLPFAALAEDTLTDKSKKGALKNSDDDEKANQLSSSKKETDQETADKNNEETNKKQKTVLSSEEKEKQIFITGIDDFQKIGTEGYPLDGVYVLQNDIDGRGMESGENTQTEPFIQTEEVFTGVIHGGGHTIANFNVKRAEEGEKNTSMFGRFGGRLEEIQLLNIQVISEANSGAVIAEQLEGAEIKNIIVSGNVILSGIEEQVEDEQKTRSSAAIALQTDGKSWEEFLKLENQKTKFSNVKLAAAMDALSEKLPEGLTKIKTSPEYLSTVERIGETIEAPELDGFAFAGWTAEGLENNGENFTGKIEAPEKRKTKITGKEGKYRLKAAYEYELNIQTQTEEAASEIKHTAPLILEVPYIVGKDIRNIEKLIPIDNVFPKQITAVMYLETIDGVFPKKMEVGKKTENEKIAITSWEQFKNIGNTDYNSHFVMDANYVLEADIYSDGKAFTPIGTEENPFTGSFDGNGYSIDVSQNPEIDENKEYYGLFGVVQSKNEK